MRPRAALVPLLIGLVACAPAERPARAPAASLPTASLVGEARTPAPTFVGTSGPVPPSGRAITVEIGDDLFTPPPLTMTAGTSVTWVDHGQSPHTATAHDDSFASPTLLFGGTYTRTFTTRGRYLYTCLFHPAMWGELIVE
ncbi:MAG TPA: plastocyanin/azurin family copper-binding protein [Candidatus Limnocylindria bacterium]|nr:plastocyanin/azurin family copper-binding protein [Candidatus Limnocylindria bacterium]